MPEMLDITIGEMKFYNTSISGRRLIEMQRCSGVVATKGLSVMEDDVEYVSETELEQSETPIDKSSSGADDAEDTETGVVFEDVVLGDDENGKFIGCGESINRNDMGVEYSLMKEFSDVDLHNLGDGVAFVDGSSHKLDTLPVVGVPQKVLLDWDDLFKRSFFYTPTQQEDPSVDPVEEIGGVVSVPSQVDVDVVVTTIEDHDSAPRESERQTETQSSSRQLFVNVAGETDTIGKSILGSTSLDGPIEIDIDGQWKTVGKHNYRKETHQ